MKLKNCQFCKSKYSKIARFGTTTINVFCNDCRAVGPVKQTEQEAIKAWNTSPIEDELVEALEEIANNEANYIAAFLVLQKIAKDALAKYKGESDGE